MEVNTNLIKSTSNSLLLTKKQAKSGRSCLSLATFSAVDAFVATKESYVRGKSVCNRTDLPAGDTDIGTTGSPNFY